MTSDENIWPSAPVMVPPRTKQLITRFFDISDATDPASGEIFAEEFFTRDGFFKTHETCVFKGRDAIASSRKNPSPLVTSRAHQLFRVYAADSPATDIVVLGKFIISLKDSNIVHLDFTARIITTNSTSDEEPRFQSLQVWTDPTDMTAAMSKAKASFAAENGTKE